MNDFIKRYRIAFLVAVLLICSIQFLSYRLGQKQHLRLHERLLTKIAYPLEAAGTTLVRTSFQIWHGYFYLVGLRERVLELQQENDALRANVIGAQELRLENNRLRELLNFQQQTNYQSLPARVIGRGLSGYFHVLRIDKGSRDGVQVAMPVVSHSGIVGQVVSVSKGQAEVLLLVDGSSSIDVLSQRTRSRGLLKGGGQSDRLEFRYLSKFEDIQSGDLLVASGLDGIYPKGLPVGKVAEAVRGKHGIFYQRTAVTPAVDFDRLEEVLVILLAGRPTLQEQES